MCFIFKKRHKNIKNSGITLKIVKGRTEGRSTVSKPLPAPDLILGSTRKPPSEDLRGLMGVKSVIRLEVLENLLKYFIKLSVWLQSFVVLLLHVKLHAGLFFNTKVLFGLLETPDSIEHMSFVHKHDFWSDVSEVSNRKWHITLVWGVREPSCKYNRFSSALYLWLLLTVLFT